MAHHYVLTRRHCITINEGFKNQLREYEMLYRGAGAAQRSQQAAQQAGHCPTHHTSLKRQYAEFLKYHAETVAQEQAQLRVGGQGEGAEDRDEALLEEDGPSAAPPPPMAIAASVSDGAVGMGMDEGMGMGVSMVAQPSAAAAAATAPGPTPSSAFAAQNAQNDVVMT